MQTFDESRHDEDQHGGEAISRTAFVEDWLKLLHPWMNDPSVTEIAINRPGEVFIERASKWEREPCAGLSYMWLEALAVAVAKATHGQDINDYKPILSGILPRGERIQIVKPPACEAGIISITIRMPSTVGRTLADYVESGFFKHVRPASSELTADERELLNLKSACDYAGFLSRAVKVAKNIVVAGETGSGKTTFMKALIEEIPTTQRLITIEDVRELFLRNHPNHVNLLYPAGAKEGDPVTAATLLKSCMRMKPDRILLAELRGGETYDFMNAAVSGHNGSITSCHAGSAALTFERMAFMMQQNQQGRELPYEVIKRQLFQIIDVVVHIDNDVEGDAPLGRHITEIWFDPQAKRAAAAALAA